MSVLILSLIILSGWCWARYFLPESGGAGRAAMVLFFSCCAFLPAVMAAFFTGRPVTPAAAALSCGLQALLALLLTAGKRNRPDPGRGTPVPRLFWACAALVVLIYLAWYSNVEFIVSLASLAAKGEASCFYLQAARLLGFVPAGEGANAYSILTTPGNAVFSVPALTVFGLQGLRVYYAAFGLLLFLSTFLLCGRLGARVPGSLCAALFMALNPCVLSTDVLDRNLIALSVSSAAFYILTAYPRRRFLHGLVFGVLAGTGLRFLPLVWLAAVALLYSVRRAGWKEALLFIPGFLITFTFNTPHLFFHGFHALGETRSLAELAGMAVQGLRTPFLPFANPQLYALNLLDCCGIVFSSLAVIGFVRLGRRAPAVSAALACVFLLVFAAVAVQANWLEADKNRILMEGLLAVGVFIAFGLDFVISSAPFAGKASCVLVPIALWLLAVAFETMPSAADTGFYRSRFLYQKETDSYHSLLTRAFPRPGLFPDYVRLGGKLDLGRKRREERLELERLVSREYPLKGLLKARAAVPVSEPGEYRGGYVCLKLDFDRLAGAGPAVELLPECPLASIDLSARPFESYYASLPVSWQREPLTVTVIPDTRRIRALNELEIHLNAFTSGGRDADGFERIVPVSSPDGTGVFPEGSFPLYSEGTCVFLKIPAGMRLVIKNWFVNEAGTAYRLDSWSVRPAGSGRYTCRFSYNEPESPY